MEGSSESACRKSSSSRGLNTSRDSDHNPRRLQSSRIGLSDEALHDSGFRKQKSSRVLIGHTDQLQNQGGLSGVCVDEVAVDPFVRAIEWGDVSLRQWLDRPERSVDAYECVHIFRQIVEIVNVAHFQGIVVHNVRPSCFVMSSFNHVSFIESASCSDSGSDTLEDGLNSPSVEVKNLASPLPEDFPQQRSNMGTEDFLPVTAPTNALSETSCMQSSSIYAAHESLVQEVEENRSRGRRGAEVEEKKQSFPMKQILLMETNWYSSPEEVASGPSSCASDIYRLGVLLFEASNGNSKFFFLFFPIV